MAYANFLRNYIFTIIANRTVQHAALALKIDFEVLASLSFSLCPFRFQNTCTPRFSTNPVPDPNFNSTVITMGKSKDKANESVVEDPSAPSYEDRLQHVSVIAKPMASKKLTKKLYKVIESNAFKEAGVFRV